MTLVQYPWTHVKNWAWPCLSVTIVCGMGMGGACLRGRDSKITGAHWPKNGSSGLKERPCFQGNMWMSSNREVCLLWCPHIHAWCTHVHTPHVVYHTPHRIYIHTHVPLVFKKVFFSVVLLICDFNLWRLSCSAMCTGPWLSLDV